MFSWRGQAALLPDALSAPRAGDPQGHPQGLTWLGLCAGGVTANGLCSHIWVL